MRWAACSPTGDSCSLQSQLQLIATQTGSFCVRDSETAVTLMKEQPTNHSPLPPLVKQTNPPRWSSRADWSCFTGRRSSRDHLWHLLPCGIKWNDPLEKNQQNNWLFSSCCQMFFENTRAVQFLWCCCFTIQSSNVAQSFGSLDYTRPQFILIQVLLQSPEWVRILLYECGRWIPPNTLRKHAAGISENAQFT